MTNSTNKAASNGPSSRGRFATTSWSLVVQAADGHDSQSRMALETLCQLYWYPLYAFVRRKGHDAASSEDLTQAFLLHLLENDRLQAANRQRGRFRTFLLSSLNNFINNQWREQQAQKRGGGKPVLSIDFHEGEKRYLNEPYHDLTPERIFLRSWALTVMGETIDELGRQYKDSDKGELFEKLKPQLAGDADVAYREIGEELGMSEGAVKVAVHRMRARCREVLRDKIGETVEKSDDIDQ